MSQTGRSEEYYNELKARLEEQAVLEDPSEEVEKRTERINSLIESEKRTDKKKYEVRLL